MAKVDSITPEMLRELLDYNPETGKLYWKERDGLNHPAGYKDVNRWNSRHAGKEALTANNAGGYKYGNVMSTSLLAHRVAWAIMTGSWPSEEVDHINWRRGDNRWCNLRSASRTENARNHKRVSGSVYLKGVSPIKRSIKYQARIYSNGKLLYLGAYESEEDAHQAYMAAANKLHGEFVRTE